MPIVVELICSKCGADLQYKDAWGVDNRLMVEPCQDCAVKAPVKDPVKKLLSVLYGPA